jgi:transposase
MDRTRVHEGVRRMRFEGLLDRHERGELSQMEAAEMLGIGERSFRRWRDRWREEGPPGLAAGGLASPPGGAPGWWRSRACWSSTGAATRISR